MAKEKDAIIIISENFREVDFIKNYGDIMKECRESYYYLLSLENFYNTNIYLIEGRNEVEEKILSNKLNEAINEFQTLDKEILEPKGEVQEQGLTEAATTLEEIDLIKQLKLQKINLSEMYNYMIRYFKAKEKIDRVQMDLLDYLIKKRDEVNKAFTRNDSELKLIYTENNLNMLLNSALNHSSDEDKLTTYKITCSDRELNYELKKSGIYLPKYIKVEENSFNIKKKREILKAAYSMTLTLFHSDYKIQEERELQKLAKDQHKWSRQVTKLTWIAGLLTIITTIMGGISLYYTIIDHKKDDFKRQFNQPMKQTIKPFKQSEFKFIQDDINK